MPAVYDRASSASSIIAISVSQHFFRLIPQSLPKHTATDLRLLRYAGRRAAPIVTQIMPERRYPPLRCVSVLGPGDHDPG